MTDCEFLLELLSDGDPHALMDIIAESTEQRGHGLTVHSRASDLRGAGHTIHCERVPLGNGRVSSTYQLISLSEPDVAERLGPDGASGSLSEGAADVRPGAALSLDPSGKSMVRGEIPRQPLVDDAETDDPDSPEQLAFEVAA